MTFEQVWESARFNEFFWLSHLSGFAGLVLFGVAGYCIKRPILFWISCAVLGLVIMFVVTGLTVQSIQTKWRLRSAAAATPDQQQAVANRDGANLVFAPVIGGFQAMMYCGAGVIVILIVSTMRRCDDRRELTDEPWRLPPKCGA